MISPVSLDDIAHALQGYDPTALRADHVLEFLSQLVSPIEAIERVALHDALGRVLAADQISPFSVPPHDNSAMDGYAFHGALLDLSRPHQLQCVGTALAGKAWSGKLQAGECLKIMTGAVMPPGLDTVAPIEICEVAASQVHIPAGRLTCGDNRRLKGEDLREGEVALPAGAVISPAALGLLASLGLSEVAVRRRLKVAYFSTGDEILSLGDAPREGAVYDSNRYTMQGMLGRLDIEMLDLGVVRDDPDLLEQAFQRAAAQADAIITSGGVSVGEADHTRQMMKRLCLDAGGVAFWRIAMRPGRPMAVGRLRGKAGSLVPIFGLPGNPVAVVVTFLAFVRPALLRMMGSAGQAPIFLKAATKHPIRKRPGRTEYQRAWVSKEPDRSLSVAIAPNQGSGVLSSVVRANGLVVLHHDQGNLNVGEMVDVWMLDGMA